jgi:hypothetical protein
VGATPPAAELAIPATAVPPLVAPAR